MTTIGIPRALHYYKYYPLWHSFFQDLGFDVVISPATNRVCLERGTSRLVSDTCIPVKTFIGHVLSLKDQCDMIYVPVLRSIESKVYNCSRLLGLPDLVRAAVPEIPKVVEIDMDINRGEGYLKKQVLQFSRSLNVDLDSLWESGHKAKKLYDKYLSDLQEYQLTYQEGIDTLYRQEGKASRKGHSAEVTIGLIGHPYVVNDDYFNHNLIQRIRKQGARIITPEMLSEKSRQKGIQDITGQSYWTSETEVIGAAGSYFSEGLDGIIGVTAFSCGPDSLMMSMVKHQANVVRKTPFLCLTVDEHSSETGLVTRLEAFLEMIYRQKRKNRV